MLTERISQLSQYFALAASCSSDWKYVGSSHVLSPAAVVTINIWTPQIEERPAAATRPLAAPHDLVLTADVEKCFVLILFDPCTTFETVALRDCVDAAVLLPLASQAGQESPTLYLILKMPSDAIQGLTFLIRLVNPRLCPNTFWDERGDRKVSDNIGTIMLADREMWIIWSLRYHNL